MRTAGRKSKPIPADLLNGLEELGYVQMEGIFWRHPAYPQARFTATSFGLAGEYGKVVAQWTGQAPTLMLASDVVDALTAQIERFSRGAAV